MVRPPELKPADHGASEMRKRMGTRPDGRRDTERPLLRRSVPAGERRVSLRRKDRPLASATGSAARGAVQMGHVTWLDS